MHKMYSIAVSLLAFVPALHARKNVLFIMADDFNFWLNRIGYYPQSVTPNLDSLSRRGVLFRNAHCSSPVSNPSRNALWSGLRPSTTGISSNQGGYVRNITGFAQITSMHQYFLQQGYYAVGGGKLWHPGSMGGPETDASNWSSLYTGGSGSPGGTYSAWASPTDDLFKWSGGTFRLEDANDTKLANHFANLLRNYKNSPQKNAPFFFGVGLFRPHLPWNCHKQFWDMIDRSKLTIPPGYKAGDLADISGASTDTKHREILAAGKWMEGIHAYLANLAYADYNVGLLMNALDQSGLRDSTIVVFVGDHGWQLGEKERWSKYALYDMAHWTTLIVADPTARGNGGVAPQPVSMQDLYPTLVDLAELPHKNDVEGRSLRLLLDEPQRQDWNWPIVMTYNGTNMVKTKQWRLVDNGTRSQLYNMLTDPYEWDNVYGNPGTAVTITSLKSQMDSVIAIGTRIRERLRNPSGNQPPVVRISNPEAGVLGGGVVVVRATASDPDGQVRKVEFYDGVRKIGERTASPWEISWTPAGSALFALSARALDNEGGESFSPQVLVRAGSAGSSSSSFASSSSHQVSSSIMLSSSSATLVGDIGDLALEAVSKDEVRLVWSDVQGETGYRVRRRGEAQTTFTNLADLAAGVTSYTDTHVLPGISYTYMVRPLVGSTAVGTSNLLEVVVPDQAVAIALLPTWRQGVRILTGGIRLAIEDGGHWEVRRYSLQGQLQESRSLDLTPGEHWVALAVEPTGGLEILRIRGPLGEEVFLVQVQKRVNP